MAAAPSLRTRAGRPFRALPLLVGVFNPLSALGDRAEDIADEAANFDVFALVGTQSKAPPGYTHGLQSDVRARLIVDSGWGPGVFTNKSAGCWIMWGRRFDKSHLRRVFETPAALQGRLLAARCKNGLMDITAVAMYFPPKPKTAKAATHYRETCTHMTQWLDQVLLSTPHPSLPIILTDLSDGIGNSATKSNGYVGEGVIKKEAATKEFFKGAGECLREVLYRHHMAVYSDTLDPTWFGKNEETSRLDCVIGPVSWKEACTKAAPLLRMGRRLQCIPDRQLRDHVLVHATIMHDKLATCDDPEASLQREKWNLDSLVYALRHGDLKHDFLTKLNEALQDDVPRWVQLGMQETPDAISEYLEQNM
ncbi:unnamed protein product, partial [Prorocentrum cordatum]